MEIRRAEENDIPGLAKLLRQVLEIHHAGRPDLFRGGVRKYTDSQLAQILSDDKRPVFAAFSDGKLT
ncbi:MAG: N-acetyltransferase, partial [Ruminiclostridium sp.]|nr:N-acetyltransferase [Ruminiclostridium sp.]